MSTPFLNIPVRRVGDLSTPLRLALQDQDGGLVAFASLTNPVLKMRRRVELPADAVTGAGSLAAAADTDRFTADYTWHADDPQTPGVYVLEVDTDGPTYFAGLMKIVQDVG